MTFRARIVRLCLAGSLALAGISAYCQALEIRDNIGACLAALGGAAIGIGLLEIVRAIFAPRAESGGTE